MRTRLRFFGTLLAVRTVSETQQSERQHRQAHQHQQARGADLRSECPEDEQHDHKANQHDEDSDNTPSHRSVTWQPMRRFRSPRPRSVGSGFRCSPT